MSKSSVGTLISKLEKGEISKEELLQTMNQAGRKRPMSQCDFVFNKEEENTNRLVLAENIDAANDLLSQEEDNKELKGSPSIFHIR